MGIARTQQPWPSPFGVVLALFVCCTLLEYAAWSLRYLKYALPFACLLIVPTTTRPEIDDRTRYFRSLLLATSAVALFSLLSALSKQAFTTRFFVDSYLILAPMAAAGMMFGGFDEHHSDAYARRLFAGFIAAYVIEQGWTIVQSASDLSSLVVRVSTSMLDSESTLSLIFGAFAVFFFCRRQWRMAGIAFVFTVLGFKRIAMLGVLIACAANVVLARLDPVAHRRAGLPLLMVAVNAAAMLLILRIIDGSLGDFVMEHFNVPLDFALMGRVQVYQVLWEDLGFSWFGHGFGSTTHLLAAKHMDVTNAHSDVLKYTLELGPFVAGAWMYMFYRLHSASREHFTLMLYLNVLFLTDNVSIYLNVMLTFFILTGFLFVPSTTTAFSVHSGSSRP